MEGSPFYGMTNLKLGEAGEIDSRAVGGPRGGHEGGRGCGQGRPHLLGDEGDQWVAQRKNLAHAVYEHLHFEGSGVDNWAHEW